MAERITIARVADVPPGRAIAVEVEGLRIALFNVGGVLYALDDTCSHAGGSLAEGTFDEAAVECPLHGARFELRTGRALSPPADGDVAHYRVHVKGEEIQIEVD